MSEQINTHFLRLDFGRHIGELWTRVPVSYLLWLVSVKHPRADVAQAELERRGSLRPNLDVTGHAIDRASLTLRALWLAEARRGEGIHAWLTRRAEEALELKGVNGRLVIVHRGIRFVFGRDGSWPVLKTVMPSKGGLVLR